MGIDRDHLLDGLPAVIWTAQRPSCIASISRFWSGYTGLDLGSHDSPAWQAVIHPEDLPLLLERWELIRGSSEPASLDARIRRFDGQDRWFRFQCSPVTDGGKIAQWCWVGTDVDDLRRTQDVLQRRELDFQLIIDSIPVPVAVTTPSGELEGLNQPTLAYFGRTMADLKGWTTIDAVHPDDLPGTVAAFQEAHGQGSAYNVESRHLRADGVYRWFNVRGFPLRDPEGRILRWFHLLVDIDDRKQTEEALRTAQRTLIEIVETIPVLAWSARPDGSAEFFNRHFLDYLGLSAEEAKDWGWAGAVHPDDLNGLVAYWQANLASGQPGEAEARLRRFDGAYRWLLFRTNPLRDERGSIVRWYGTNTDIDDQKRVEKELRRSEASLADAQRLSRTGSFTWRIATGEVELSDEAYRILGFATGTSMDINEIRARVHPENRPVLQARIEGLIRQGGDLDYETRLQMPDGSIKHLRVLVRRSHTAQGGIELSGAIQDVTESRLADEALTRARSDLAHVARVTSLGVLTASIAHEVSQPVSGILMNASTGLRMLDATPPNVVGARETVRRTIRDGNRAADIITRLRALYSKRPVTIEPIDLNEIARDVITLLRIDLQRNRVIVQAECSEECPPVAGDRVQLQQVVMNLLRNAADSMSTIEDRPRRLVIWTERDGTDHVRLSVQDTGIGLKAEGAERLFEAFYTTKHDGMGIGLSISRSIIESLRGRLWATPNDGPGATFAFSIPVYSTESSVTGTNGLGHHLVTSSASSAKRPS